MLDIGHSLSTTAPAARTCAAVQGPAMQTQAHSTCSWTCLASPKPNDCSILLRAGAKNARQHDYPVLRPRHAFSLMLQRSLHHSTSQQAAVHAQSGPPGQERASNSAHSTSQHTAACTSTSTSTLIQLPQIASLGEVAQPAAAAPAAASAASAAAFAAQQATANTGLAGAVGIGGASSNSSSAANAAVQAAGGSASAVGQAASAAGPTGRTTTTRTDAGAAIDKDPGRVSKYAENEVEDDDDDDLDYPVVPPEVELEPPSWAYMMGIAGLGGERGPH